MGIRVHDYVIASDVFDVYFVQCSSIFVLHVREKQQGLLIHVQISVCVLLVLSYSVMIFCMFSLSQASYKVYVQSHI